MPERIAMRYTVALRGFSDFERSALSSFFRLGQQREPAYDQGASLDESDFVIADADDAAGVELLRQAGRLHDTVFIGAREPAEAVSWLRRPIEPTRILRALDLLLEQRLDTPDEPAGPGEAMLEVVDDSGRPVRDVLVVDDSRIALKFLQVRLQRLGYRVHVAHDAAQAQEKLATHTYAVVFLDVVLGDEGNLDGLALCQQIKQGKVHPAPAKPAVVMVTGRASATDRVRGDLAGCDAYLTKPLMEEEFLAALREVDPI